MAHIQGTYMISPTKPRYQELKEMIIARIASGELKPLDPVPSENQLVTSKGVSRMTANRVLRELHYEGYVERITGVGTFVADLKTTSHALEVRNIADEVYSRGHKHRSNVLTLESYRATPAIAKAFHLSAESVLNHVLLVHFENDIPIQIEDRYATVSFAPDFLDQDFQTVTPSTYLSSISPLQESEHVVRAKMPCTLIRKNLEMEDDEPCLLVMRRTWVQAKPVSFARLYHPGNRFELTGHYVPPGSETTHPKKTNIQELRTID